MFPLDLTKFRKELTKNLDSISVGFNDPKFWVSTGSYALNYMISGDFNKGVPLGKVVMIGGESGSGKSYLVSGNIAANAQKDGHFVVLLDSENALDTRWLHELGVSTDEDKLLKISVTMIDDVARIIFDFVKGYRAQYSDVPREQRPKVVFIIDSLGMLLTPTDVKQFSEGDMKGDMGRKPKALNALVRNCVNMFGDLDIGLVATNHTYASQDMFDPDPKISGGCLVPGTGIQMADGTIKNIEDIVIGDTVKTMFDNENVSNIWHYKKTTLTFEYSDGEKVSCTPEHKFLVAREEGNIWIEANDIQEGDEILSMG